MSPRRLLARIVAAGFCIALNAPAGAQPVPPRDRPPGPPPQVGTARISGRIADALSGSPVPRVRVRLAALGVGPPRLPVLTDDSGAFQFVDLPAAAYIITAEKSGYLNTRYPDAGRTMRSSTTRLLTMTDGQSLEGITVPLYRGGVIAGRVTDAHGEPLENVQVQALWLPMSGKGKPQQRGWSSSNDLGEFRAARLEPGHYFVVVQHRSQGPPDDPVQSQPMTTYYPGVPSIDQAQRITLARGQTVSGVEIMMLEGIPTTVTGTVVDANGQPTTAASVSVRQIDPGNPNSGMSYGSGVRPDGTFQLKLAPGEYEVEARGRTGLPGLTRPQNDQVAIAHVSANGVPISGLALVLGNAASISGRIVFDGNSALPAQPQQFRAMVQGPPPTGSSCRSNGQGEVNADWTFRIDGAFGTCVVRVMGGGNIGKWNVKAVLHDDADLQDQPTMFVPGQQVSDVQVVMTDRRTELSLHVSDEHGVATREYVGLVFPVDKTKWYQGSRYVRTYLPPPAAALAAISARSATATVSAGVQRPESIAGLPAGEYYAIAVEDLESDDARDADTLERLAAEATRVTLTDRGPVSIDLRRRKN